MSLRLDAALVDLSIWIDSHPANLERDTEARMWGRVAKIGEECGEVIAAMIGATGQNPRKGVTHTLDDVEKELLDVAITALAAWVHVSARGEVSDALESHLFTLLTRAGLVEGVEP